MSLHLLLALLLLFSSSTSAAAAAASFSLSAYHVLQSYNFPIGLLPVGALGYVLDPATGDFAAYFADTCSFPLESYQIRYNPTVTGRISTNRISRLRGVSVKVLFFWINIVEVVRRGNELEFSVGIVSTSFSIENFYVCPQCGCGFDCSAAGDAPAEDGGKVNLRSSI
ncbi:Uncharacterized protein AXF42_Ash013926 [Apostasia shenzhenica]|uniref:Uncharacterized protein n=1 Tax=Apostasia shenzhenica TaxID=1088818 RepID=A0A2I0ASA5_9ASPA|nr:Uncharacterized protein AXF42_Ash013926 [Apostasia shenzhenica]